MSRAKFESEITDYLPLEADYRTRGWFLVKADWPTAVVVLASSKTSPPAIVTGVQFDYTNYDAEPPSVRLVDPFSGRLLQRQGTPNPASSHDPWSGNVRPCSWRPQVATERCAGSDAGLHSPEDLPFLCIAGVKEYHDHPGHSGDPWELHRSAGEGRLVRLLDVISKYGLDTVTGFQVNLVPQVTFGVSEPPL